MKKASMLGCSFGIVLLLLIGGVLLVAQIPPVADQLPVNANALLVTLSLPANGSTVALDQLTTITAEAIGSQPIVALELWIDGALAQKKNAPPGSALTQFAAFWTWTPPGAGDHTLVVRARDAAESVAQSNIVRVSAAKAEPAVVQVAYAPQPGESVSAVATKFKTTPQEILDLNPQINPTNPLPPNQPINVPIPIPTSMPPDPDSTSPSPPPPDSPPAPPSEPSVPAPSTPQPWWFWIKNLFKANQPPPAPSLWAKTENCTVRLTVKDNEDNEDGFFIYRLNPATLSFERIATLDAHASPSPFDYIDSDVTSGEWQYFITAFSTKGESPSGIVKVVLSGSVLCAKLLEPTLTLNKGKLMFTQKIDKAYCYVAINGGKWTRVPPAPSAFIFPDKNGAFDVSPWINQLPPGDVTLEIECWGWQADALVYLGKTVQTFKSNQKGPVQVAVDKLKFTGELDNLPILKPLTGSNQKIWLAPPTDLKVTGNGKVCTDHMPGPLVVFGGAVWFDLSGVPVPIVSAALKYKFAGGIDNLAGSSPYGNISCADYLMLGKEDWRGDPYGDKAITIPAQDYVSMSYGGLAKPGDGFYTDVTAAVNEWLLGTRPNYGFVMRGFVENVGWKDGDRCASVYDDFELVIQHYGQ